MRPGPKPMPRALQLLRGERRPSRVNYRAPAAPLGLGPPPTHLTPDSRAVWLELAPVIEAANIGTKLDGVSFELLVDALADYRRFRAGDVKHAAFAASAWKRCLRAMSEFGLSPSSRTSVPPHAQTGSLSRTPPPASPADDRAW